MTRIRKIIKDPTVKLINNIRDVLSKWKIKAYITNSTYNSIYCDANLPRVYELPKIHKPCRTFRIIILFIDRLTNTLVIFLHKIIAKNISINLLFTLKIVIS